jgi:hypothetical protein
MDSNHDFHLEAESDPLNDPEEMRERAIKDANEAFEKYARIVELVWPVICHGTLWQVGDLT